MIPEHAPANVMDEADEIARFYDRCSDLMRALLDELATTPGVPRTFPDVEDAIGWPRRRLASVLGGVAPAPDRVRGAAPVPLPRRAPRGVGALGAVDGHPAGRGGESGGSRIRTC